jgi:hypothetical protein
VHFPNARLRNLRAHDQVGRIGYARRAALERRFDLIDAYPDTHADLGREEAVAILGIGQTRASQVLVMADMAGRVHASVRSEVGSSAIASCA